MPATFRFGCVPQVGLMTRPIRLMPIKHFGRLHPPFFVNSRFPSPILRAIFGLKEGLILQIGKFRMDIQIQKVQN